MRKGLEALAERFDEIWIDTPPALNFYTRSALIAAHGCLNPFDCDEFSRRALYALVREVEDLRADHNPDLGILGVIVNQFQSRARLPGELVDELIAEGLPVLQPYLGSTVKERESHQRALPLIHLEPAHKLAQEFVALYETIAGSER